MVQLTWIPKSPPLQRASNRSFLFQPYASKKFSERVMPAFGIDPRQERETPRASSPAVSMQVPTTPVQAAAAGPKIAVLGPTLHFKGELSAEEDFVLQGKIEGSIANPQNV